MDPLLPAAVDGYLDDLVSAQHADPVLTDMERRADMTGFPIIGRAAGRHLELTARLAKARRVVELGSGFGYSAYWLARAVGADGDVICIDNNPDHARHAENYLRRADLFSRIDFRVGDALETFAALDGEVDLVFCDVDKHDYPAAFAAAASSLPVGGVFVCDNVLWYGRAVGLTPTGQDPEVAASQAAVTDAVVRMNREVANDPRFVSSVVPIGDGLLVAQRIS